MRRTIFSLLLVLAISIIGLNPANAAKLEDDLLNCVKDQSVPLSIYLVNGIKLQGVVKDFDDNIILLTGGSVDQMVYISAISTIVPSIDCTPA